MFKLKAVCRLPVLKALTFKYTSYISQLQSQKKIHSSAVSNFIHCEDAVLLGVDDVRGSTGEDQSRLGMETTLRFVGL